MIEAKKLLMRAVQLDLARQPEKVEFVKWFIDFIGDHGYNALVLYLEGRIRTETFHHLPEDASYSLDEIKRMIDHAAIRGIEVIPVFSMLGHAEHFLKTPEFEHLAELRGDIVGRFNKFKHVFCPSLPETVDFLERYTAELAALFPSEWFHAGFDEAWDIGYCELCRPRLATEGQAGIFAAHLLKCHEIVTQKLHKKMMIWDDMFELYPEALEALPRDVVLCAWHYERRMEYPFGHIGGPRQDALAQYDRMGFKYLFAPATHFWGNAESFTEYARTRNPLGGLLTAWGETTPAKLPTIAATGKLWSEGQVDFAAVIREISRTDDPAAVQLIHAVIEANPIKLPATPEAYLRSSLSEAEYDFMLQNQIADILLGAPQDEAVRESVSIRIGLNKLYFALRDLLMRWFGLTGRPENANEIKALLSEQKKFAESLRSRYGKVQELLLGRDQKGEQARHFQPLIGMLEKLIAADRPQVKAHLRLRFPANSNLTVSLRCQGSKDYRQIWNGNADNRPFAGEFQYLVPFEPSGEPEAVRIEHKGAVDAPLSYLEIVSEGRRYVPQGLSCLSGKVQEPAAMLRDGRNWCVFGDGEQLAREKFLNPDAAQAVNRLEVLLTPASDSYQKQVK